MEARVSANLAGSVLKQRTGKLAGSVGSVFRETDSAVFAKVGTNYYVGRFWEKGFKGEQTVRAHFRAIKHGRRFELKKVTRRGNLKIAKIFPTGAVPVKAYERKVDGSARPWLQPALDSVREEFRQRIQALIGGNGSGS